MKVLWLCDATFSIDKSKLTASWLQPLATRLQATGKVSIVNVTVAVRQARLSEFCGIRQYEILAKSRGLIASSKECQQVAQIVQAENPDLIHVWGTEGFWLSLVLQSSFSVPYVLDIQGLLYLTAESYYGNFTFFDIVNCISLKEILMPWRTLWGKRYVFRKRGKTELKHLRQVSHISYQSDWVLSHLLQVNPFARYHSTKILLRDAFYCAAPWQQHPHNDQPIIFTSASGAIPYKGIDVAIRVVAFLKESYPNIRLHIAGQMAIGNRLLDGISIYLQKLIRKLDLTENVVFLGPLDDSQIVQQLQLAHAALIPSFVETYCLAFAESMIVGTPTVCASSGAMPELATDHEEALFYQPSDIHQAAHLLKQVITDTSLAQKLSVNSRARRLKMNDPVAVIDNQLFIYSSITHA